MTLIPKSEIRSVREITPEEQQRIYDFLQGAVYCWCKNKNHEAEEGWFGLRDLMGGKNYYWNRTALISLWVKHKARGLNDDDAVEAAAKDGGWLLKRVIAEDRRSFETKEEGLVRKYRWTGDDGDVED